MSDNKEEYRELAENECILPNWENRSITRMGYVNGRLWFADLPYRDDNAQMSRWEVKEALDKYGDTPDGWGKALRYLESKISRDEKDRVVMSTDFDEVSADAEFAKERRARRERVATAMAEGLLSERANANEKIRWFDTNELVKVAVELADALMGELDGKANEETPATDTLRHKWVPIDECGKLERGKYRVRLKTIDSCFFRDVVWSGIKWNEHWTHLVTHVMSPLAGPIPEFEDEKRI